MSRFHLCTPIQFNRILLLSSCDTLNCQALERELAPVEERLSKLGKMTRKVAASNPQEGRQVQARNAEISELWDKLKVQFDDPI